MHNFFSETGNACRIPFADLCRGNSLYQSYFTYKTYQGSETIHPQGDRISHFGIVVEGLLKAVNHTVNGVELCQNYFEKKDIFPELLYFSGKTYYTYSLAAAKKSTVAWIPVQVMAEMLERDTQLMYSLLLYISQRGLKDQLYLNCLNYQTIRERVAHWIVGMNDIAPGGIIRMPSSQAILANMLHVSRSSLNQELKQMEKQGFFQIKNHMMYVRDVDRLSDLL